jgi:prophage antirepressor-like protein
MTKNKTTPLNELNKIAIFRQQSIRRQFYHGEWWFVINDVVAALIESADPAQYVKRMRQRDPEFAKLFDGIIGKGAVQIVPPLLLKFDTDGGKQSFNCWHTEGIFRLVQSIPSARAEPFKRWLARVGYERVQEIENPELAQKRMKTLYRLKGYDEQWIERRTRGIATRNDLTDEWDKRGGASQQDYAILTAEISKATFGITPSQYKKLKGLKRENLRDHMDYLELLFTELGEASSVQITRAEDSQGLPANKSAAKRGGKIAGEARTKLEQETGRKVVREENYLTKPQRLQELEK